VIPDYSRHPVQFLYRRGIPVVISQDNSWILHTRGLSSEFVKIWFAHPNFKFSDILSLIEQGFRGSFLNKIERSAHSHKPRTEAEMKDARQIFDQAA
jgi:adenosine deaminase